jgi:hypothetical protein
MKPATASVDNGVLPVQKPIFGPEGISIRFRPENSFLNSPFGPDKSPFSPLLLRSFMKNAAYSHVPNASRWWNP